jgi:hypothetical protein
MPQFFQIPLDKKVFQRGSIKQEEFIGKMKKAHHPPLIALTPHGAVLDRFLSLFLTLKAVSYPLVILS